MAINVTDTPRAEGNVITTDSGLILPPTYRGDAIAGRASPGPILRNLLQKSAERSGKKYSDGYCYGYPLSRDADTLIVRFPQKGSGIDDILNAAIVDGAIANAGIAPTIMPQISALVKRQESQARAADITLTGRKTPVTNARNALARANDSPLGVTQFIGQVTYQLRVFNRGAPMATVPITYPVSSWADMGMMAIPIDETEKNPTEFYLKVDWAKRGAAIPFLPDVWDLIPSGNATWPYWYRTTMDGDRISVLLHCSQIICILPMTSFYHPQYTGGFGATSHRYPLIGTSAVYMLWTVLADQILIVDAHTENIINKLTDGFLGISGIEQSPEELKDRIEWEADSDEINLGQNYTILTSEERIFFEEFNFRKETRDAEFLKEHAEDLIAITFEEPLQAVVQRGGLSVHQAEVSAEGASDAGVNSILDLIGKSFGAIYKRVQVTVARQNDQAQRLNMETFNDFSSAIRNLPEGTLTRDEIRAIIDRDIMDIPQTGDDIDNESATADKDSPQSDEEQSNNELARVSSLLDMMYRDAWLLESIQEARDSDTYAQLVAEIQSGLQGSYDSVDIDDLVSAIEAAGIDIDDEDAVAEIVDIIIADGRMDPAEDHTDLDLLLVLLLALGAMGINQAEENAADAGQPGYTGNQRAVVIDDVQANYVEPRLDQLYIAATGGDVDEPRSVEDPLLSSTLDNTSREVVARSTRDAIRFGGDAASLVAAALSISAENRAALTGDNEGLRGYANGQIKGGRTLGATHKQWLETVSANPRADHLNTVGEIVPINAQFSNGLTWSAEVPRCQCGIRELWL